MLSVNSIYAEITRGVSPWAPVCVMSVMAADFAIVDWRGGCGSLVHNQNRVIEAAQEGLILRVSHAGLALLNILSLSDIYRNKRSVTPLLPMIAFWLLPSVQSQLQSVASIRQLGHTLRGITALTDQVFKSFLVIVKTLFTQPSHLLQVAYNQLSSWKIFTKQPFFSPIGLIARLGDLYRSAWSEKGFRLTLVIAQLIPIPTTVIIYQVAKVALKQSYSLAYFCMTKIIK